MLGTLGLGATLLGFLDSTSGLNLESKLSGGVYFVVGLMMLGSATRLMLQPQGGRQLALLAGAAGALLAFALAYAQAHYLWGLRILFLGVWILAGVASVLAAVLAWQSRMADAAASKTAATSGGHRLPRELWSVSTGFALITLLLGLAQFWNSSIYEANASPLRLIVSPTLADAGMSTNPGMHLFAWQVSMKNPGQKELLIITSTYQIRGITTRTADNTPFDARVSAGLRDGANGSISRDTTIDVARTVEVGTVIDSPATVAPNWEYATRGVVEVPQAQLATYTYLRLFVNVIAFPSDRFGVTAPTGINCDSGVAGTNCVVTEWTLKQPSWFSQMIRGDEVVDIEAQLPVSANGDIEGDITYAACVRPGRTPTAWDTRCRVLDESFTSHLGQQSIVFEVPLASVSANH